MGSRKVAFEEVVLFQEGPGVRNWQFRDCGIKLINIKNIVDDKLCLANTSNYLEEDEVDKKYSHFLLNKGDFVMASSGVTWGKIAEVGEEHLPLCLNTSIIRLVSRDESVLNKWYLYYFIKSPQFRNQIERLITGSAQPNFGPSHLKKISINIPIIGEQQEVVSQIVKIESVIKKRKVELEELDNLIKSRFVEMFGDPIINPKGWEVAMIGDIITDVRYGTSRPAVEGGRYPYLRMNNLTIDGHLDLSDLKYIDIPEDEIEKCIVRKGDVLFNRTNSIELVGKTAVFDLNEEMVIAGYIIRVRLNDSLQPEILVQYMNLEALKDILRGMAKGAVNQANINAQELQSIKVYIPDIELQKQFLEMKYQVDKLKVEVQKSLDEMQLLFDSLMQKYFG